MKTGYYTANINNGVTFYDVTIDLDVEIMNPREFLNRLSDCGNDDMLYTFMDESNEDIYNEIKDEYGITFYPLIH